MVDVRRRYDRLAQAYDAASRAQALWGFRDRAYHRLAVRLLDPPAGGTVVDVGCGTGLNLAHLVAAVGPRGRVVGVDLSEGMLRQARRRVEAAGWSNVELVRADAQDPQAFGFPPRLDGVLATWSLQFMPQHSRVVGRALEALRPGARIVTADLHVPAPLPWLAWPLVAPFGHAPRTLRRRPWHRLAAQAPTRTVRRFAGMARFTVATRTGRGG